MKVVFLNRCYWPDFEATGQLLTDLAENLAEDFDVHVVCGQPNSATTESYERDGIQKRNGVTIHRLRHTQFPKRVPAGRILNLLSFTRAAKRYLRKENLTADIFVAETDPFLLPAITAKHSQQVNARFVAYLQDIYPDVAEAIGKVKPGRLTRNIRERLRVAYRSADAVVVLGVCMRNRLTASPWSIDPDSMHIIPNWADCQKIIPVPHDRNPFRKNHRLEERFAVMHSGNMGLTQNLEHLVDAVHNDDWPDDSTMLLVGDGAARQSLEQKAQGLNSRFFRMLPYQDRDQLSESLSAADVHIVSMDPAITGCLCPSKLYGILAAGRPVIAITSDQTDLAATVLKHDLGIVLNPIQLQAASAESPIIEAINRFRNDEAFTENCARNARHIAETLFDRPVVFQKFKTLLDGLR